VSRVIAVFGSSATRPGDTAYEAGVAVGRVLASSGFTVATGGYGGTMEAVSRGAAEGGGSVVGVTAPEIFRSRLGANAFVSDERRADTIARRISMLVDGADGYVVLPGSLGTATELLVVWNDVFLAPSAGIGRKPLVVVTSHWRPLVDLLAERFGADPDGIVWAETAEAVAAEMRAAFDLPGPTGILE
jgi:uncharacterized protein (TIGR00730 family)